MISLPYLWAKGLRRLRGAAVRNSDVHATSTVEPGSSFVNSAMARHSFCGYDCEISGADIGAFCSIANRVAIGGGRHPIEWASTSPTFYEGRDSVAKKFSTFSRPEAARVSIGSDVWIGYGATIMQGVSIGHGAVIGAGAVVTRDIPDYAIVAGVPATVIRYRFDEVLRQNLLESRWWDVPDGVLEQCADEIRDPVAFLRKLSRCV